MLSQLPFSSPDRTTNDDSSAPFDALAVRDLIRTIPLDRITNREQQCDPRDRTRQDPESTPGATDEQVRRAIQAAEPVDRQGQSAPVAE